jgi:hypothetical protein
MLGTVTNSSGFHGLSTLGSSLNRNACVYFDIVRRFQSVIHNRVDISGTPGASPATGKTWGIWGSLMHKFTKRMWQ